MDPFEGVPRVLKSGRYELVELIGTGGAAEVWRARDNLSRVDLAIKVLNPSFGKAEDFASRFLAEAKVMFTFKHPRIVRVLDVGKEGSWLWFAMDLHAAGTLKDRLATGKLPVDEALKLAFQVLEALAAAHARGIIHRDIKPGNVLIDRNGDAVVTDFGVAHHRPEDVRHRTEMGAFFGSLGYAAPEQRKDARSAASSADVYSVGATLFVAITGNNPADLAIIDRTDKVLSGLPPEVRVIVARACAAEATARYVDARAMAEAIAAAREALGCPLPAKAQLAELDQLLLPAPTPKGCLGGLFG